MVTENRFRDLPAVGALLDSPGAAGLVRAYGRTAALEAVRQVLDELRGEIAAGGAGAPTAGSADAVVLARAARKLEARTAMGLGPAVNATGVLMHSGLGRALLSEDARRALDGVTAGYCDLALDLDTGRRTRRDRHVETVLRELTGAPAATVANNNAAATMLILHALAAGRDVVVSRGQLVEIGGSFRLPEVMASSGAILREVGATNKTHLRDYAAAIGPQTGALLRVHHSNYRIVGFAGEPGIEDLARLGRERGIPVIDDLGSGALVDLREYGISTEPLVRESLRAGASVACFSGDKLIGGPQCGIIVGEAAWIEKIRTDPLARAFRCGKLTLAALEATLRLFLSPDLLRERHPLYRMLATDVPSLEARGQALVAALSKDCGGAASFAVEPDEAEVGSGAAPIETLPSRVVAVRPSAMGAGELARRLRLRRPPVFSRVRDDAVALDLRTIQPAEDEVVAAAVSAALKAG